MEKINPRISIENALETEKQWSRITQRRPIYGYVLTEEGIKVAGARVEVQKDGIKVAETIADQGGFWIILDLPDGLYSVKGFSDGFVSQEKMVRLDAEEGIVANLQMIRRENRTRKED